MIADDATTVGNATITLSIVVSLVIADVAAIVAVAVFLLVATMTVVFLALPLLSGHPCDC